MSRLKNRIKKVFPRVVECTFIAPDGSLTPCYVAMKGDKVLGTTRVPLLAETIADCESYIRLAEEVTVIEYFSLEQFRDSKVTFEADVIVAQNCNW